MIVAPGCKETTADFDYDFCSYFASVFAGQNAKLEKKPVAVKFTPSVNVPDELSEFAKKIVWYGRRNKSSIKKSVRI